MKDQQEEAQASSPRTISWISVQSLKEILESKSDFILLDIQEEGDFANGHIFHSIHLPYSRLELNVGRLVPNRCTRIILTSSGDDGVPNLAFRRLSALGYTHVEILQGGNEAWLKAGNAIFQGVHVPSKTFGELVEHHYKTPSLDPSEYQVLKESANDVVLLDGRPFEEFQVMTIPGSTCCPNGELALQAFDLIEHGVDHVVVNCAGRTRSIIGAETLRRLSVEARVFALRNGTQGWTLSGRELERGAQRRFDNRPPEALKTADLRAQALIRDRNLPIVSEDAAAEWMSDDHRTTYLFDVRSPEEFAIGSVRGAINAPGGQLVQATDKWIGVKSSRVILFDNLNIRSVVTASWLVEMGFDAHILIGATIHDEPATEDIPSRPNIEVISPRDLTGWQLIDIRSSKDYIDGHPVGASWSIRPLLHTSIEKDDRVAFVSNSVDTSYLASLDAYELGAKDVRHVSPESFPSLQERGTLDNSQRIDYMSFTAGRHDGNREAAIGYLNWETNLVKQLGSVEWSWYPNYWPDGAPLRPV